MSLNWSDFVAQHAAMVLGAALRVLARSDDADEVAQDVFLEIFESGNFQQLHSQPALIRTIATRRAIDRLRRQQVAQPLLGTELSSRDFEACEYTIAAELDQRLRASLANLPKRESEVFCLYHYEDLTTSEIAASLNISRGAVAKSLCLARNKLSAALGQPNKGTLPS